MSQQYAESSKMVKWRSMKMIRPVGYVRNFIKCTNGMEMNVEKTKVMRISRQPSPVTITIDQKQTGECEMF